MLPPGLTDEDAASDAPALPTLASEALTAESLLGLPLAEAERRLIEATLALHGGSIPKAARVLDVSPSTLYRKIEAWSAKAG
jgi:DNA-binding NtrC family response regulator